MSTKAQISKLTIPQLKALCKERGITGYSKLAKPLLIEKLTAGSATEAAGGDIPSSDASVTATTGNANANGQREPQETPVRHPTPPTVSQRPITADNARPSTLSGVDLTSENAPNSAQADARSNGPPSGAINTSGVEPSQLGPDHPPAPSQSNPGQAINATHTSQPNPDVGREKPLPQVTKKRAPATSSANPAERPAKKAKTTAALNTTRKILAEKPPSIAPLSESLRSLSRPPATVTPVLTALLTDISASLNATHPSANVTPALSSPQNSIHAPIPNRTDNLFAPAPQLTLSHNSASSILTNRAGAAEAGSSDGSGQIIASKSSSRAIPMQNQARTAQKPSAVSQNRFKPLVMASKPTALNKQIPPSRYSLPTNPRSTFLTNFGPTTISPSPHIVDLKPISLPPSLSKRSLSSAWAIILSAVEDTADLRRCVLVSKFFRYAIYLSALMRLQMRYSGSRLTAFLDTLTHPNTNILNFWPYLLQRQQEVRACKALFAQSFLGGLFKDAKREMISANVWTAVDGWQGVNVAVRFLLTRAWYSLSTDQSISEVKALVNDDIIVDAKQVSPACNDIWKIVVQGSDRRLRSFLVVEKTGEIVGQAFDSAKAGDNSSTPPIRADWALYIKCTFDDRGGSSPNLNLLDHLKWPCHEEYVHGISRHWLRRLEGWSEEGKALREVGESYTGRYMTAGDMEMEYAGNGSAEDTTRKRAKVEKVNMFLPIQHHVESVHFTTTDKRALHPALAIVFTQAREYYVLRDNGMTIGCEEDGIAKVWMGILECGGRGEMVG